MKKLFILAIAAVGLLACTGQNEPNNPDAKNGALPGEFSVAADKKVHFSQGNLQYQASTGIWRFAENQYDTIGIANLKISPSYDGWIDMFGWGTGNNPTLATSNYDDYQTFTDWGVNKISNGGNTPNTWFTLSGYEWEYLLCKRTNAQNLFGTGRVNGVSGLIILPDNWLTPSGCTFASGAEKGMQYYDDGYAGYSTDNKGIFGYNSYTITEWKKMEEAGAVFLPAYDGVRRYDDGGACMSKGVSDMGFYWYSVPFREFPHLGFWDSEIALWGNWSLYYGMFVRLVKRVH